MRAKRHILCLLALSISGSLAPPAQAADPTGWRLKLQAAAFRPTSGGGFDPSFGGGLALEYRATRRLGFEVSALTSELVSEVDLKEAAIPIPIVIETRFEATPILARLNWHLTPAKKADVYIGPVAGWILYGDGEVRFKGKNELIDPVPDPGFGIDDGFAWGAHAGVDVPVGGGGWFLHGGLTYLLADVESDVSDEDLFDLDPLVAHIGIGYRF